MKQPFVTNDDIKVTINCGNVTATKAKNIMKNIKKRVIKYLSAYCTNRGTVEHLPGKP